MTPAELEAEHFNQQDATVAQIQREYADLIRKIAPIIAADAPRSVILRKLDQLLEQTVKNITVNIETGMQKSWDIANERTGVVIKDKYTGIKLPEHVQAALDDRRGKAAKQFQKRRDNDMNLSDRVWKQAKEVRGLVERKLDEGISKGRSAASIAKELRTSLNDGEPDGKGGRYASPKKNTERLTRTETNMSYRMADQVGWESNPLVLGYRVSLSASAKPKIRCAVCRALAGVYPKTFVFKGWHPNCYSDDTSVLTNSGWKLFKDLKTSDLIYSLNPDTKQPEYVKINVILKKSFKGEMIRFSNRSLDLLVTPDHPIKYLNKRNLTTFEERSAGDFKPHIGPLYRSSEYKSKDVKEIIIGEYVLDFDLYTEFMAYYLAEGSLSWTRKNQFHIAQCKTNHKSQYEKIISLLSRLPFKYSEVGTGFYMRDETMYNYLKQFGKSPDKHVPFEILNASPRQIAIFLDGYGICDGHTKKTKREFMGNRGGVCVPNNFERVFFSTSDLMAANIGEMLTKIGKRPSYRLQKAKGVLTKHHNGEYESQKDIWVISECHSKTATVYKKSTEQYDGIVYDVQLEKNHIMYVRRNGKCVWGSNCLCFTTPILMSRKMLDRYNRLIAQGKDTPEAYARLVSKVLVREPHEGFKSFIQSKGAAIGEREKRPYWYDDNNGVIDGILKSNG